MSAKGRVVRSLAGACGASVVLATVLAGCGAGIAGAILGIRSLSDDGGSDPSPPLVANLQVEPSPGASRACDLRKVEISFALFRAESYRVEFSPVDPAGGDLPADFREVRVRETSSAEDTRRVLWNAREYGLSGLRRVRLRVTPTAGGKP